MITFIFTILNFSKYSKLNKGANLLIEPQHQQNINLLVQTFEPDKIGGKFRLPDIDIWNK